MKKKMLQFRKEMSRYSMWVVSLDKRRNWRLEVKNKFEDKTLVCDLNTAKDRWAEFTAILKSARDEHRFLFLYGNQAMMSKKEWAEFHRLKERFK